MIKIRCSQLGSLFACPPSVLLSGPDVIRVAGGQFAEAALLGSVCHEAAALCVKGEGYDLEEIAERTGLSEKLAEQVPMLMSYVTKAWEELEQYFPEPQYEASVKGPIWEVGDQEYQLTGTIDLCSPCGDDRAIFLDWKSGYLDDGFHQQMAGYAFLLWEFMGRPDSINITGVVVFLRHRYHRVIKYTGDALRLWEHDLLHNVLTSDSYTPSSNCRFCGLYALCAARKAIVVSTIDDIMGTSTEKPDAEGWLERAKAALTQLTEHSKLEEGVGEVVHDMLFRIRLLQQVIDNGKGLLRETIARVGPIPTGEGKALALNRVEKRKLDPLKAMVVLRNHLSDTQIAGVSTVSLPKALKSHSDQFIGGKKKEAREELLARLEEAGAISVTIQHRLEETHLEEEEGEKDGS